MKIAICFSGQGSQYSGMMRDIYQNEKSAKEVFFAAEDTLKKSIADICFSGDDAALSQTINTQPCLLAADLAAWFALSEKGISADAFAGFSLGEYAALAASGCLDMKSSFLLVDSRAKAMEKASIMKKGLMAAVMSKDEELIQKLIDDIGTGYLAIANYNSPEQIVISGEYEAVSEFIQEAKKRKIRSVTLNVSVASHCALMEPAADELRAVLETVNFSNPKTAIYMNVDGIKADSGHEIKENLIKQLTQPVQWVKTIKNMYEDGIDTFIECGPGKTLSGLIKKIVPNACILNVESLKDLLKVTETLKDDI